MQTIKDTKTSLLLKSFLLNNQDYLSISILYYFDFNNPDIPLEEQAMYREIKEQLGKTILDFAMPKPKAEVLVCGSCYNNIPENGASHVKLEVGNINKELYVFGERRWSGGSITKPLPFKSMPIDFSHATGDGDLLPNIEEPKSLVTSKNTKKIPASFMPIDITSMDNMKKLGTFDEGYRQTLWPGFASDMDYSFFNVAPYNQQQDGFFEGGEGIKILNMHPQKQLLSSSVPQTSFRCFATIEQKNKDDEFKEIKLQRDTLWLFPDLQRGIVIFRGTLKIADEIYSDIKYLNIKPVFEDEKLKTLDEYYELQKKELDRSVEIDEAPLVGLDAKITEMKKEVFDIPREIKNTVLQTQQKRPSLKRTTAQRLELSNANLDEALGRVDSAKIKIQELKDEFGHITKIDTSTLEDVKADLLESKQKISNALKIADEALKKSKDMKLDSLNNIKSIKENLKVSDEIKARIKFDFLEEKEKKWDDYAFDFVCDCVKNLEKSPEELHKLRHLGFAKRGISRAWFGINTKSKTLKADEWKLDLDDDIELPKGFVTARFEEVTLKALRIDSKLVLGSDEDYELFLSEESCSFPLFYFKNDDIQAHLCDQEAFDICNVLSCGDISKVGDDAKDAIEKACVVFYLQEDGVIDRLAHAKKFDCGEYENLFELHKNSVDIREQIIQNIPKDMLDKLPIERDFSAKGIREKTLKITDKVKSDLEEKAAKLTKELEGERDKVLSNANEILLKKGLDPITPKQPSSTNGLIVPSDVEKSFDKAIAVLQKQKILSGTQTDGKILELQKAKERLMALAVKGEAMHKEGMKKIAQAKQTAKDPIPQWAKDMMKKAGIDPDDDEELLSREDVIKLYEDGKSFKSKNLSNLDLSNLNLSGIDLSASNCTQTNFKNTDLSKAKFAQTNFTKADFTHAKLSGVVADMSNFKESVFDETVLENIKGDMLIFTKAVLKNIKLKNTSLEGYVFKQCNITDSTFESCSFDNTVFLSCHVKNSSFNLSKLNKLLFSESTINECQFVGVDAKGILFNKTKVTGCDFSQSRLFNTRMLKNSIFEKNDFSSSDMAKTTMLEIVLEDCNLKRVKLDKSLIKKSQIQGCDFEGAIAKGARFEYALAKECCFVGVNLFRGSLRQMDLKICDFSNANLYGVEFYKAKFYEVKLDGANLKRSSLEGREDMIYD